MAQRVARKTINEFKQSVDYLISKGFSVTAIGDRIPQVGAANFSSYYNEQKQITAIFLAKYHEAWKEELEPDEPADGLTGEIGEIYRVHDTIVEKLVDAQNKLINSNIALVEYNQKLMDELLRLGASPGLSPDA